MEIFYKQQARLNEGFVESLKIMNSVNANSQSNAEEQIQYDPSKYINSDKIKKPREKLPPQRINTNSNCYSDQEYDYRNKSKAAHEPNQDK